MRPIKFRAWDKTKKRMVKLIMDIEMRDELPDDEMEARDVFEWPELYDIMQFTGLKDKNGNEIYEGDIIDSPYGTGPVAFYQGSFNVYDEGDIIKYGFEGEIIGNIYEHPHLLEERKWRSPNDHEA